MPRVSDMRGGKECHIQRGARSFGRAYGLLRIVCLLPSTAPDVVHLASPPIHSLSLLGTPPPPPPLPLPPPPPWWTVTFLRQREKQHSSEPENIRIGPLPKAKKKWFASSETKR